MAVAGAFGELWAQGEGRPAGLLSQRTLQLHPTLRCNLRCLHCYSSSAPQRPDGLEPRDLIARLEVLRTEGYEVASFSGGEPLAYRGLYEVAEAARALDFRVNLVTNGLLLDERHVARLQQLVSLVGVSIDGVPERHDRIRGCEGAFEKSVRRLQLLRDAGIPFGISHCVTRESVADLPWLAEFALGQGALLLQLHPLTLSGRASETCTDRSLTGADLSRVALIAELLRIQYESLTIQLDLVRVRDAERIRSCTIPHTGGQPAEQLSEMVNPLVLDAEGRLWPLAYGMHPTQCLTPADPDRWKRAISLVKSEGAPRLRELVASASASLAHSADPYVDWYGLLVSRSHELGRGNRGRVTRDGARGPWQFLLEAIHPVPTIAFFQPDRVRE